MKKVKIIVMICALILCLSVVLAGCTYSLMAIKHIDLGMTPEKVVDWLDKPDMTTKVGGFEQHIWAWGKAKGIVKDINSTTKDLETAIKNGEIDKIESLTAQLVQYGEELENSKSNLLNVTFQDGKVVQVDYMPKKYKADQSISVKFARSNMFDEKEKAIAVTFGQKDMNIVYEAESGGAYVKAYTTISTDIVATSAKGVKYAEVTINVTRFNKELKLFMTMSKDNRIYFSDKAPE